MLSHLNLSQTFALIYSRFKLQKNLIQFSSQRKGTRTGKQVSGNHKLGRVNSNEEEDYYKHAKVKFDFEKRQFYHAKL